MSKDRSVYLSEAWPRSYLYPWGQLQEGGPRYLYPVIYTDTPHFYGETGFHYLTATQWLRFNDWLTWNWLGDIGE